MKRTPLFDIHSATAANIINLKGFARPVEYVGHVAEHRAIRERVSLCDVSHMGELEFEGEDALRLVDKLITNDASKLCVNQGLYTVMCDENGFVIDDLVCLRVAEDRFIWVVNVTKTDEDYHWVLKHSEGMDVRVRNRSSELALIALQGPYSSEVLQKITATDLSKMAYYRLAETAVMTQEMEVTCIISRTGYTGEHGYEICVSRDVAPFVWEELMRVGQPLGIVPHGVAARESTRTEAGYLLNGNDMDDRTYPYEVGLDWVVKLDSEFIGRDALAKVADEGVARKLVGLEIEGSQTIRHGYRILKNDKEVGLVTSGPLSPQLLGGASSFGLGFVSIEHARDNDTFEIDVRGHRVTARVVSTPFCERRVRDSARVETLSPYALHFSEEHVWVHEDDTGMLTIGLTEFGQRQLGEVLHSSFAKPADKVTKGSSLGWLDTYRKPFDLISPVSGEIASIVTSVGKMPSDINKFPYARNGLIRIEPSDPHELKDLMPLSAYMHLTRDLERYEVWSQELRLT
tara:strand:+ start:5361 stop:6911 length:1551 start_codon:yes stop_codon:yes gene_type:complete